MLMFIDEEKIAKELIENFNLININTYKRLQSYTKYLKHQKLTKNEIRNKIDELMIKYYSGFVMADWDGTLQAIVNKYTKPHYREYKKTNTVLIYEDELELIKKVGSIGDIESIEVEKILFILLALGKLTQYNKDEIWVNQKSIEIFKLARFKYKQKSDKQKIQREKLIYDLGNCKEDKLLEVTTFGNSPGIKLLYGSEIKENEIIKIDCEKDDLENIIVKYLNWRSAEDYSYCVVCGDRVKIKGEHDNSTKYCSKCKKNKQLEWQRQSMKKARFLKKCEVSE